MVQAAKKGCIMTVTSGIQDKKKKKKNSHLLGYDSF